MPFGFQWVDLVAGLMSLEMLIAWIRVVLVLLLTVMGFGFGIHSTVLGQDPAAFLGLSFAFDAVWLVGMGLIGSLALREWRTVAWIPLFPFFYFLDLLVNLYSALTIRRGLSAVWKPPERAKKEVLV